MPWQLILDITVAILLVAFIVYAMMLSRQLKELRKNRDDMAKVIATFNEATARAEAGIPRLRKTAEDAGTALDEHVAKARTLRDDLAYMVERADGMATRLEAAVRVARGEAKPSPREGRPEATRGSESRGVETRGVETRAIEARGVEPRGIEAREPQVGIETRDAARERDARLAAARPRPRARAEGAEQPPGRERGPLTGTRPLGGLDDTSGGDEDFTVEDERSEAERELLRALQSAR